MIKKFLCLLLIFILSIALIACDNNKNQTELLKYSNIMTSDFKPIEDKFYQSFKSVTGENYIDDATAYTELTTNTVVLARTLSEHAVELFDEINDEEILKVHKLYINYTSTRLNSINLMINGIENNNMNLISTANEKLNEANDYILDYKIEIKKLEEKYNLDILSWI